MYDSINVGDGALETVVDPMIRNGIRVAMIEKEMIKNTILALGQRVQ
jgi:hypothetical protein